METENDPSVPSEDDAVVNSGEGDDAVIGQAFRYSLAVIGGVVLIAGLVFLALRRAPEDSFRLRLPTRPMALGINPSRNGEADGKVSSTQNITPS